jgi:hypothetical protein
LADLGIIKRPEGAEYDIVDSEKTFDYTLDNVDIPKIEEDPKPLSDFEPSPDDLEDIPF